VRGARRQRPVLARDRRAVAGAGRRSRRAHRSGSSRSSHGRCHARPSCPSTTSATGSPSRHGDRSRPGWPVPRRLGWDAAASRLRGMEHLVIVTGGSSGIGHALLATAPRTRTASRSAGDRPTDVAPGHLEADLADPSSWERVGHVIDAVATEREWRASPASSRPGTIEPIGFAGEVDPVATSQRAAQRGRAAGPRAPLPRGRLPPALPAGARRSCPRVRRTRTTSAGPPTGRRRQRWTAGSAPSAPSSASAGACGS
jgi:hypothetical protein